VVTTESERMGTLVGPFWFYTFSLLGLGATVCIIPLQEGVGEIGIECSIQGDNKKLIKTYQSEVEIKKSMGSIFTRKYGICGSESVVMLSFREALDIIEFLINKDRDAILKLAKEYQEGYEKNTESE